MNAQVTTYIPQWQSEMVSKMIKNLNTEELTNFALQMVNYGCILKGQNKSEKDVKIIAQVFISEAKRRFAYLTTSQIELALKDSDFGEYGITAEGMLKSVVKYYPIEKQKQNADIERQINTEVLPQLPAPKELDKKEKIKWLRKGFDFWKIRGYVCDIDGDLFKFARELTPQYTPSFSDKKKYVKQARISCYEYFFEKDKFKYQLLLRVEYDKKLLSSKKFKDYLRKQYKEMWLRDYYKRSKWNSQREI